MFKNETEMSVNAKYFGLAFRSKPRQKDYDRANKWLDDQLLLYQENVKEKEVITDPNNFAPVEAFVRYWSNWYKSETKLVLPEIAKNTMRRQLNRMYKNS